MVLHIYGNKYAVVSGKFHVNPEDGAKGWIISTHRLLARAEAALAQYNRAHRKDCACGGGSIMENPTIKYGKAY